MKSNLIISILLSVVCLSSMANAAESTYPTGSAVGSWSRDGAMDSTKGTELERGKAVFHNRCAACHGAPGYKHVSGYSDMPGTSAIGFKYKNNKPRQLEDWTDLTPELVKYFVRNGSMFMPAFRKTYVTDKELDVLAAYLSSPKSERP